MSDSQPAAVLAIQLHMYLAVTCSLALATSNMCSTILVFFCIARTFAVCRCVSCFSSQEEDRSSWWRDLNWGGSAYVDKGGGGVDTVVWEGECVRMCVCVCV